MKQLDSSKGTLMTTPRSLLIDILQWRRPYGSNTEKGFIKKYIRPTGAVRDSFGNYILEIPSAKPTNNVVLWSSHLDTVHKVEGMQLVTVEGDWAYTNTKSSNCLGADCSTGIALMLQMIHYRVPGSYVFHAGEERGCLGSTWMQRNNPEWLKKHTHAVAFDRRKDCSVITHQMGINTASEDFVDSFIDVTGMHGFLKPDDGGSYTDTYQYKDLIPECTNISVGYDGEHTAAEIQDLLYYEILLDALLSADFEQLAVGVREEEEPWDYFGNSGYYNYKPLLPPKALQEDYNKNLICDNWREVINIFEAMGIDWETELMDSIGWEPKRISPYGSAYRSVS